jgi:hypothetical protein
MQVVNGRPSRARCGIDGSVISARVIPQASQSPRAIMASASAGATMRPVAITGTDTASRIRRAKPAMALCSTGTGGTIQLEPR